MTNPEDYPTQTIRSTEILKPSSEHWQIDSVVTAMPSDVMSLFGGSEREDLLSLYWNWTFQARPDQLPPTGDWTTWLMLGGRGAGKTRAGAEWIHARVRQGAERIALVAETFADGREVMLDGPSGLLHTGKPTERPRYEPSRRRVSWPSGAEAFVFSAEDPDGLRGYQFDTAWSDELAKWTAPEETWSNLQMGLRLGDAPRQVVTTTPRTRPFLKELMARNTTAITRATSFDNRSNLAKSFFTEIAAIYEGTALGRQELLGELIEDQSGALWSWSMIEGARGEKPRDLARIVVAVDPPVTSHEGSDACGILVAGVGFGPKAFGYILDDATVQGLTPQGWAEQVSTVYHRHRADRVVVEVNQGGDLVTEVLRAADPSVPVKSVRASRGKLTRAEPVAALYEQGRVRHTRPFPELEDQLTSFTGDRRGGSPDRLDALVWAITELMLGGEAPPTVKAL